VRGSGDHDQTVRVWYQGSLLEMGAGFHWTYTGLPREEEVAALVALEERDVITPWDIPFAEYRGRRADGTRWRFLGYFGQTIRYETKSGAAAAYFDRIIDSLCWTHS